MCLTTGVPSKVVEEQVLDEEGRMVALTDLSIEDAICSMMVLTPGEVSIIS